MSKQSVHWVLRPAKGAKIRQIVLSGAGGSWGIDAPKDTPIFGVNSDRQNFMPQATLGDESASSFAVAERLGAGYEPTDSDDEERSQSDKPSIEDFKDDASFAAGQVRVMSSSRGFRATLGPFHALAWHSTAGRYMKLRVAALLGKDVTTFQRLPKATRFEINGTNGHVDVWDKMEPGNFPENLAFPSGDDPYGFDPFGPLPPRRPQRTASTNPFDDANPSADNDPFGPSPQPTRVTRPVAGRDPFPQQGLMVVPVQPSPNSSSRPAIQSLPPVASSHRTAGPVTTPPMPTPAAGAVSPSQRRLMPPNTGTLPQQVQVTRWERQPNGTYRAVQEVETRMPGTAVVSTARRAVSSSQQRQLDGLQANLKQLLEQLDAEDADTEALNKDLEKLVREMFDLELKVQQARVQKAESDLAIVKKRLSEREENVENIVQERLRKLLPQE